MARAYLERSARCLARHDIVITCTASPLPILGKGMVERAIKARKHRPMFMVDLAVPRDIEPEVGELDDVFLYAVDDLAEIVKKAWTAARLPPAKLKLSSKRAWRSFMHWMESRETVPTIRALRDHAERLRRHELERALKLLARGEDPEQVLDYFARALTNKFLHGPTHALNNAGP